VSRGAAAYRAAPRNRPEEGKTVVADHLSRARAARWAKPGARERAAEITRALHRDPKHHAKVMAALRTPEALRKKASTMRVPLGVRIGRHSRQAGECVVWTGATDKRGYAQLRLNGRTRYVTHIILELKGEQRPSPSHGALHSCDNPQCVHAAHLRWGTQAENVQDAIDRNRADFSGLEKGRGRAAR
jgi:hypothetical protein